MTEIAKREALLAEVRHLLEQADSENTIRAIRADARHWSAWCASRDLPPEIPVDPLQVAAYLAYLDEEGFAVSTMRRRLATLSRAHRVAQDGEREIYNPCQTQLVRDTLRGIVRARGGHVAKRAPPFTVSMLRACVPKLSTLDRTLVLVGWAAMLRRSEIAQLRWDQIEETQDGRVLHLGMTKTEQTASPIGIARGDGGLFSPVAALVDLERERPRTHFELVFGVCGKTVNEIVKRAAGLAGEDPARFSSHSLRSGAISTADAAGIQMGTWMGVSRHRSTDVAAGYVRSSEAARNPAAIALVRALEGER